MSQFVLIDSSARSKGKWGEYRRLALLEVEDGYIPKMISTRPKGVIRVVRDWGRLHARGVNTEYSRALTEATALKTFLEEPLLQLAAIKVPDDR